MNGIRIRLERTSFEPGDSVDVKVEWDAGTEAPEEVLISLLWSTAGKGTEDIEVVEQVKVEHPSRYGERETSFRLPAFPWSFSGKLISLVWAIEASVEPKGGVERTDIVSAPGGEEVRL